MRLPLTKQPIKQIGFIKETPEYRVDTIEHVTKKHRVNLFFDVRITTKKGAQIVRTIAVMRAPRFFPAPLQLIYNFGEETDFKITYKDLLKTVSKADLYELVLMENRTAMYIRKCPRLMYLLGD